MCTYKQLHLSALDIVGENPHNNSLKGPVRIFQFNIFQLILPKI